MSVVANYLYPFGPKPAGTDLVNDLINSDKVVTLNETTGSNKTQAKSADAFEKPDGTAGVGSSSDIDYNSKKDTGGRDVNGSTNRPSFIGLGHELLHARTNANGRYNTKTSGRVDPDGSLNILDKDELQTRQWENKLRAENGISLRKL